jgi:hypothetical protein
MWILDRMAIPEECCRQKRRGASISGLFTGLVGGKGAGVRRSFANKAVGLFKISRSSCRMRFGLRRRAPHAPPGQARSFLGAISLRVLDPTSPTRRRPDAIRAIALTLLPPSTTKRTACCLDSSVNRRRGRRLRMSVIVDIIRFSECVHDTGPSAATNMEPVHSLTATVFYGGSQVQRRRDRERPVVRQSKEARLRCVIDSSPL